MRLVTAVAFVSHYYVIVCVVMESKQRRHLSPKTGLDWEICHALLVCACLSVLSQAVLAVAFLVPGATYSATAFASASLTMCMPYLSDAVDTLTDAILGGLCLSLAGSWHLLGYLSLGWLFLIHVFFFTRHDTTAELAGTYLSVLVAPTEQETAMESAVGLGFGEKTLGMVFKMTTPAKRYVLQLEELPQMAVAILYTVVKSRQQHSSLSLSVITLKLIVPLALLLFAHFAYKPLLRRLSPWLTFELRRAMASGNYAKADALLDMVLQDAQEGGTLWDAMLELEHDGRLLLGLLAHDPNSPLIKTGLRLEMMELGDEDGKVIAKALLTNQSLTFLDLTNNSIGNDGAIELAKVLQRNQAITEMKLWGNPIGKSGAEALSQAFRVDPIHAAYLRQAEAGELEQAFRINKAEVSLDLSNKGISNAGATAVAQALKENASVQTIDLGGNNIGDAGSSEQNLPYT